MGWFKEEMERALLRDSLKKIRANAQYLSDTTVSRGTHDPIQTLPPDVQPPRAKLNIEPITPLTYPMAPLTNRHIHVTLPDTTTFSRSPVETMFPSDMFTEVRDLLKDEGFGFLNVTDEEINVELTCVMDNYLEFRVNKGYNITNPIQDAAFKTIDRWHEVELNRKKD